VKGPTTPAARRALSLYAGTRGDRLHTVVRWWSCPFPALERRVPRTGRVLEVGCGHGLLTAFLALCSPGRTVLGVDVDAAKIDAARAAAAGLEPGEATLAYDAIEPGEFPSGEFDAIVIADVLYLLGPEARGRVLDDCAIHLAPGGVLVLKEIDDRPRWKARLATVQERLATGVLAITEGDRVEFAPPIEYVGRLQGHGLEVATERLDRGYPHPHLLILARRPTGSVEPG